MADVTISNAMMLVLNAPVGVMVVHDWPASLEATIALPAGAHQWDAPVKLQRDTCAEGTVWVGVHVCPPSCVT